MKKTSLSKKKRNNATPTLVKEHHKEQEWERGELAVDVGEDPDNLKQKVTRLRRKWVCDELWNRGIITDEQRLAAEEYVILCEKANGVHADIYSSICMLCTSPNTWEPFRSQHEAYKALFDIWRELGRFHVGILNMITLGNMNNNDLSKKLGWDRHYVGGLIMSVFIRLEEVMKKTK